MAYDETTADRIREALAEADVLHDERKMFGGLAMMVRGHMTVGLVGDDLMVRVGKDAHDEALARPHARPMDFTNRPMAGFVFVAPAGYAEDEDLAAWLQRALAYNATLDPK